MLLLAALLSHPALPCAAIFVEEGGTASTDAQEAIMEQLDSSVAVTWRVQVVHDSSELGWIIPLYGPFESIEEADPERFDELRSATAPQVWLETTDDSDSSGGGGCMASDTALGGGSNRAESGQDWGVEIVAEGFTGSYSYVVLSGEDTQEVLDWLDAEGYDIGPSGPAIAEYVAEGGIQLLALSVVTDHDDQGRREMPPIKVTYAGDSLRYPSLMSLYGMPEEVSTRVFLLGHQRATVGGGWTSMELGSQSIVGSSDDIDAAYADLLRDMVGAGRTFVEVWAGNYEGRFLTRLDTIALRQAHTTDAVFTLDGGTASTEGDLYLWAGRSSSAALWLLPGLLGLGAWTRRRR